MITITKLFSINFNEVKRGTTKIIFIFYEDFLLQQNVSKTDKKKHKNETKKNSEIDHICVHICIYKRKFYCRVEKKQNIEVLYETWI